MQQVPIGTRVKPLGIQRLSCAEGSKCRAVLLDPNPQVKYIAYDEERKRRVEVTQDLLIKYGLRAQTTFFYLVAKLNTDLNGEVHGDQFTVEYLQLSENLNNQFSDAITEMGEFKSIALEKVKKTANGKDFSYVQAKPSNRFDPASIPSLQQKLTELRNKQGFIASCWQLIDATTSITADAYEKLLTDEKKGNQPALPTNGGHQLPAQETRNLPAGGQAGSPMPQAPASAFPESNDFGAGDDFGGGDGFEGSDW